MFVNIQRTVGTVLTTIVEVGEAEIAVDTTICTTMLSPASLVAMGDFREWVTSGCGLSGWEFGCGLAGWEWV